MFQRMLCRSAILSFRMEFSLRLPPPAPFLSFKLLASRTVMPSGGDRGGDLHKKSTHSLFVCQGENEDENQWTG